MKNKPGLLLSVKTKLPNVYVRLFKMAVPANENAAIWHGSNVTVYELWAEVTFPDPVRWKMYRFVEAQSLGKAAVPFQADIDSIMNMVRLIEPHIQIACDTTDFITSVSVGEITGFMLIMAQAQDINLWLWLGEIGGLIKPFVYDGPDKK